MAEQKSAGNVDMPPPQEPEVRQPVQFATAPVTAFQRLQLLWLAAGVTLV